MRIDADERRLLERRNRDRIAPAIRAGLIKAPLMVMITATFWLSPAAFAKVANDKARVELQPEGASDITAVKTYSKKDLEETPPPPLEGIGENLSRQIVSVVKAMGSEPMRDLAQAPKTNADYLAAQSAMTDQGTQDVDKEKLRTQFKDDSGSAAQKVFVESSQLWKKFKSGLDFKLDFSKFKGFFAGNKTEPRKQSGNVRYGLILKDVVPEQNHKNQAASIGSEDGMMGLAGRAEVAWTIGPIEQDHEAKVFKSEEYQQILADGKADQSKDSFDFWQRREMPSTAFTGNVKLNDEKMSPREIMDKLDSKKTPMMKITLSQEQGLYAMDITTNENRARETMEHQFNVPIVGAMTFGRRYNEKRDLIKTSLNNILLSKEAPQLSVHYMHLAKQTVGELSVKRDDDTIALKGANKPFSEKPEKPEEFQYFTEYTRKF